MNKPRPTVLAAYRRMARNGTSRVFSYARRPHAIRAGARLVRRR